MKLGLRALIIISLFQLPGCANVFRGPSSKTSDEIYFEEAQKAMDTSNWDLAITNFKSISPDFAARQDVIEAWAGTYAGKCGLDFIGYFTSLATASLAGSTFFLYLMKAWNGKKIFPQYCTLAQKKMEEVSPNPLNRTAAENLFMAVLGMVKIGVYIKANADPTDTGAPAVTFDSCTSLPVADNNEIVTGLGLVTSNLVYLTAALSAGSISGALTSVNSACGLSPGVCGKTDASTVTASDRKTIDAFLATSATNPTAAIGIGSCANAAVIPCCP